MHGSKRPEKYGSYGSGSWCRSRSRSTTLASAFLLFSYIRSFLPSLPCLSSVSSPPFLIASAFSFLFHLSYSLHPHSPTPLHSSFLLFLCLPFASTPSLTPPLFKNLLLPYFSYSSSSVSLFYLPSPLCFHLSSSPHDKTPVKKTVLNTSGWDTQQTLQ